MATLTTNTFLMYKVSSSYTKLVDIKDYPDMEDSPETVETTTLTDLMRTFIPGLKSPGSSGLPFTCNYDPATFTTLRGLADTEQDLALWIGATSATPPVPDGHDGKFEFKGYVTVRLLGKGVGDVREMEVTCTPSTEITFTDPT